MVENRLKKTAVYTAIFAVLSLGIMFYRAATKSIIIAEAEKTVNTVTNIDQTEELEIKEPTSDKGKGTLVIPLETGVSSENITFEEKNSEHEFLLYINGKSPDFYLLNDLVSDLPIIKQAQCIQINDAGSVCLRFCLDGLYENQTELGDKEITVTFSAPNEHYEKIVVLDPLDDTGLELVKAIKKQMDSDDSIRIYYTRQSGQENGESSAVSLLEESDADFYIQLGEEASAGEKTVKTYYNGRFFIRNFGNVEFADQLEKNTASSAGAKALGLFEVASDNATIMNSVIPSAYIAIGCPSATEADTAVRNTYIENCASGIVAGIRASLEITDPEDTDENPDALQGIINVN